MYNLDVFVVTKGDRIAQLILERIYLPELEELPVSLSSCKSNEALQIYYLHIQESVDEFATADNLSDLKYPLQSNKFNRYFLTVTP